MEDVLTRIIDELTGDIIISQSEYDEKTIAERERNNLLDAIMNDADLNYRGDDLRIVGDCVLNYIKLVYPNTYKNKLKRLQDAQGNKEDTNPGKGEA